MQFFDRISHAYIVDPSLTKRLATAVVCEVSGAKSPCLSCAHCIKSDKNIHPDITYLGANDETSDDNQKTKEKQKKEITIDKIRAIKKDVYLLPNEANRKAIVIRGAETLNISAQNALLLMLEDPPAHVVFILSTTAPAALLDTVRSRCVHLKEPPCESTDSKQPDSPVIVKISNDLSDALCRETKTPKEVIITETMFALEKLERFEITSFICLMRRSISSSLPDASNNIQKRLIHLETLLQEAEEMLSNNVNVGSISGMICAGLIKNLINDSSEKEHT